MKVHLKFSKAKTNRVKPLVLCLAIAGMAVGTYQPVFADESPIATIVNQQKTISGKVVDENGEPIIGANIVVKGTTIGIITDINGEFTLQVPSDQSILEISYIGYKSVEISVL
ncbi:carboxypeptidase-like regulatory domain-containing protein [Parabacteroides chinchillae]